jgi:hypothetical protein
MLALDMGDTFEATAMPWYGRATSGEAPVQLSDTGM